MKRDWRLVAAAVMMSVAIAGTYLTHIVNARILVFSKTGCPKNTFCEMHYPAWEKLLVLSVIPSIGLAFIFVIWAFLRPKT